MSKLLKTMFQWFAARGSKIQAAQIPDVIRTAERWVRILRPMTMMTPTHVDDAILYFGSEVVEFAKLFYPELFSTDTTVVGLRQRQHAALGVAAEMVKREHPDINLTTAITAVQAAITK
jgi:hypothetical protein